MLTGSAGESVSLNKRGGALSATVQSSVEPATRHPVRHSAIVLATVLGAVLFCRAASLLNDPDTQWHIAVGRLMWSTGAVPKSDVFSYTFAGAPWMAKEWLSQLVLFGAYSLGDWWGVAAATVCVIAACFGLMFGWLVRRVRWTVALALVLVGLSLAAPEFVARPHVLVLPFTLLWVMELVEARERDSAPRWWTPVLMVLWANMHASYPIGLVLAAVLAGEAITASPRPARYTALRRWGVFLVTSTAAACVSPYGYKTILVVVTLFQTPETMNYVAEWQPIGGDPQGIVAVVALVLSLAALLKRPAENLFRLAAVLLLGYMMVRHVRFALLFGLLTPLLIADPIARSFRALAAVPVRLSRPWLVVVATAALTLGIAALVRPEPNPEVTPMAALQFAEAKGLTGRVYNDYDYGGFLILKGIKTFIDGRNDQLFTGGFSTRLSAALAKPDNVAFAAILDRQRVSWALVKADFPDARHLATMQGWSKLFSGGGAAVYARTCAPLGCPDREAS